ncbi:MAG: hypothetical protein HY426_01720 [Candidatus Levybacteria bacterium]|nr:hypothetical protein [Candidatus Levybacteria bacterium]
MIPEDRSLQGSSQYLDREGQEPIGRPLPEMLARVVADFAQLPKERRPEDYPDVFAYLKSPTNTLIQIRYRRPVASNWARAGIHDGYFVQAYTIGKDGPEPILKSPDELNQPYVRLEPDQVTDEPNNIIGGSRLHLTPLSFPQTWRRLFAEQFKAAPRAIQSGSGESTEESGMFGGVFDEQEASEASKLQTGREQASIRQKITGQFFPRGTTQGYGDDIGTSHFIFGTQAEDSMIPEISRKVMGASRTVAIMYGPAATGSDVDPFEGILDSKGKRPLVITIDDTRIETNRMLLHRMLEYAERHPLLTLVSVERREQPETFIGRSDAGSYSIWGSDPLVLRRCIQKLQLMDF